MGRYLIRRLLQTVPLLLGITVVILALLRATPGQYDLNVYGFYNDPHPGGSPTHYWLTAHGLELMASRELELALPGHRVDVRVQDPAGQPVAGARITTDWPCCANLKIVGATEKFF